MQANSLEPEWSAMIRDRHSMPDFRPDPLPASLLDAVLADAAQVPSWSNTQPYRIANASNATRNRLAAMLNFRFDATVGRSISYGRRSSGGYLQVTGLPDGDFSTTLVYPADLQAA